MLGGRPPRRRRTAARGGTGPGRPLRSAGRDRDAPGAATEPPNTGRPRPVPAIADHVAAANAGALPRAVCRLPSGWVVMGETQVREGYCLLLADPVAGCLNDLGGARRAAFLADMAAVGDAVLAVTGADRVNYGLLGNVVPELHAHVFPRSDGEPLPHRHRAVWLHDWDAAPPFSLAAHGALRDALRAALAGRSVG